MTLTILRLGHLGDGIAEGPDGPIFAAGALPGEVVEGDLAGDRLDNLRILVPSPMRVRPPCRHARICGGCQLQHAADSFVATWKQDVVRQALAGQGLDAPITGETITSPPRSRRRATLAGRRTKTGVLLGFHARGQDTIVPVPYCQLLHDDIRATFPALEALVRLGASRSQTLGLTVTQSPAGADVSVDGGKDLDPALRLDLARQTESFGLARLTWNGETVALRAHPTVQFGSARVHFPPGAFMQATGAGERALLQAVRDALGAQRRIADLFAGMGTFSLALAESAETQAFEGDSALIAALDRAAKAASGLKKLTATVRDLFRRPLEPDELNDFSGVVIDPPRAGAEAQARLLAASTVPVIAMVSCNPTTFARDARILCQGGYVLDWVRVVDQFRWSVHVELAARFSRK